MRRRILLDYLMSMLPVGSMLLVGCAGLSKKGGAANDDTLSVMGRWTTEMPADSAAEMGIELKADGVAASVNMPTLPYDRWQKVNDSTVAIHGTSIFDGERTELTDTLHIDKEKQTLNQQGTDIVYRRAN